MGRTPPFFWSVISRRAVLIFTSIISLVQKSYHISMIKDRVIHLECHLGILPWWWHWPASSRRSNHPKTTYKNSLKLRQAHYSSLLTQENIWRETNHRIFAAIRYKCSLKTWSSWDNESYLGACISTGRCYYVTTLTGYILWISLTNELYAVVSLLSCLSY